MAQEHIDRIPIQRWQGQEVQEANGQTTCMVCLNAFEPSSEDRVLSVSTIFVSFHSRIFQSRAFATCF
eukprot:g28123.t1